MQVTDGTPVKYVAAAITEATFLGYLVTRASPALADAPGVYDYCGVRQLTPDFLAAMFQMESQCGTDPRAICVTPPTPTHSWGNTTEPSYGSPGTGEVVNGRFTVYSDWYEGGISTAARFFEHPPYQGKVTVREIIEVWAPPSENDTEQYIETVVGIMNDLRSDEAATGGVPAPPLDRSHPSPNRGYSNGYQHDPQAVCWHITDGTNSLGWLCNPDSNASANYLIARDGHIYELVPPDQSAWANGQVDEPDTGNPLIASWLEEGCNFNQRTVSIEAEGFTSAWQPGALTTIQTYALVWLTAWLCDQCAIDPDRTHIIRHQQIDDVNRHNCPGYSVEEMDAWVEAVATVCEEGDGTEGIVREPAAGTASEYINAKGETIAVINFGGYATRILGVNYADVGGSVANDNEDPVGEYDISLLAGDMGEWNKRDAAATDAPVPG